jgi:hypothetical protein
MKYNLNHTAGNSSLTYGEICTLLCQTEACLNSSPIKVLSSDLQGLSYFSPGHFLIDELLTYVPDPDLTSLPISSSSRWQHMQQHFWRP